MRSARPVKRRRLAPLAVLLSAQLAGCAASEKAAYVSHLRQPIPPGGPGSVELAAAFGLDAPASSALAEADASGSWDR